MSDKIFIFNHDCPYKEFKKDDKGILLGFTYQDCGPLMWFRHLDTNLVVASNPSGVTFFANAASYLKRSVSDDPNRQSKTNHTV